MPLTLHPPTASDVRTLMDLMFDGYSDDPVSACMYPVPASEASKASAAAAMAASWGRNPNEHMLLARDPDLDESKLDNSKLADAAQDDGTQGGRAISWAHWIVEPRKEGEAWREFGEWSCPPDWDREWFLEAMRRTWERRVEVMGGEAHVYFQTLVTPPAYRRRGAGTKLVQAIVDFAASANLPVYVTASPKGAPLYRKFGFQEKSSFTLDISKVSPSTRTNLCMLLPAPRPDQSPSLPPHILPLDGLADHIEFQRISDAAFGPSEIFALAFGTGAAKEGTETLEQRAAKELKLLADAAKPENGANYGLVYHKAVDPLTGAVLGCAKWYLVRNPGVAHRPFGDGWPASANAELCDRHFGEFNKRQERAMAGRQYALMCVLVVDPKAQRRGVGGALLRTGLREVDRLGWKTWIDATAEGQGLYKKFGWVQVDEVTTDLKPYGGEGDETTICLVREPGAKEASVEKTAAAP